MAASQVRALLDAIQSSDVYPYTIGDFAFCAFSAVFLFRYVRLILHVPAYYLLYQQTPEGSNPTYLSGDVTVLLPTVSPDNANFRACLTGCMTNRPNRIIIITVGDQLVQQATQTTTELAQDFPSTEVLVVPAVRASKRVQVGTGIRLVETAITVLMDDSVIWGLNFLSSMLAAFEDSRVGFVGTNKKVTRVGNGSWLDNFWNIMGALYLARANFDTCAPNTVDGGVPVISGRTSAIRTVIVKNREFLKALEHERFWWGWLPEGPHGLNPDDDNLITREVIRLGWRIKFQHCGIDTQVETALGLDSVKFRGQLLRWARTTFRSNPRSLQEPIVWRRQPWSIYAVQIAMLLNFALFFDTVMMVTLLLTKISVESGRPLWAYLIVWILLTKTVKLLPYYRDNPRDLWILPFYWGFGYWHSYIKFWAMWTFYVTTWTGRNLP